MKLGYLMIVKAIISFVFGIGFVLIPSQVMSIYGVTLNSVGSMMTQLLGASFILIAMMLWLARNANGSEVALRAIVLAVFLGDTISFIVMLLAQLSIAASPVGWFNVMIYLLLALGFGYFQFVKPDAT